tara:strand:- start:341 stop:556 length:216 start_codon:yes stop_codon:yes gene_type:complete
LKRSLINKPSPGQRWPGNILIINSKRINKMKKGKKKGLSLADKNRMAKEVRSEINKIFKQIGIVGVRMVKR